jgi:ligand-binding SRPBCC domain-containing protein
VIELTRASELAASREAVWERISSLEGVNDEFAPWMRMTAPRGSELTLEAVPLGERWFRSWVLLFGVLPFDYDDLCIERIDAGRGFLERSRMLSARVWEHERTLETLDEGRTLLRDRVAFEPRIAIAGALQRRIIAAIFKHRHRRLERFFGSPPRAG